MALPNKNGRNQAGRVTSFRRHYVEVNSHNLGGGHVCWGSYDGFNFAGRRGRCEGKHCMRSVFIFLAS